MIFQELHSIEEIHAHIDAHPLALLYITSNDCGMCQALKPLVITSLETLDAPISPITASINELPALSGEFMAFSAPVLLFYDHGKELLREAGIIYVGGLASRIRRQLDQ